MEELTDPIPYHSAASTTATPCSMSNCRMSLKRLKAPHSAVRQVISTICASLKCRLMDEDLVPRDGLSVAMCQYRHC
jgi:hypothetical protein